MTAHVKGGIGGTEFARTQAEFWNIVFTTVNVDSIGCHHKL